MPLTVLLVDDEPLVLIALGRLLRNRGFEVLTADNGAEALSTLESHPVDVVLSDICMPDMDGPTLLRTMRERSPPHDCPVIFLTGYGDTGDHVLRELGADIVLSKPIAGRDLLEALEPYRSRAAHR